MRRQAKPGARPKAGLPLLRSVLLAGSASLTLAFGTPAPAAATPISQLEKTEGYVPFYWDAADGKVLIEVPAFDEDILYYVSAATNPGSVQAGFDRGVIYTAVIHFERSGDQVIVNQINTDYRALDGSEALKQNVKDSFPTSVLAVLPVVSDSGGRVVVDGTPLFMRDAGYVTRRLKRSGQGDFKFDPAKSAFYPKRMKAFPENTEIETVASFTSAAPGVAVSEVMPAPDIFTIRVHHSFLKAPTGYQPRAADPRIGVGGVEFKDFSRPIDESPVTEWVRRWRLEKKDPTAAMSEPVEPIVYYFDPAMPDPLRKAMKEGLLWWNKAFAKAGFINAIEARDAPADMDPMDIRYAYVLWIQRDQRGFSSSGAFIDPRTGEVLGSKTHMDAYRVRTVANYYDAYSGALPEDGGGITVVDPSLLLSQEAFDSMPKGQRDMSLLRQAVLSAHELGHTLGFGHNWNANMNDRSSVMEYPVPRVRVKDGKLDLSEAFMTSIGDYDSFMVRYAYTPFAEGQEEAGLDAVIAEMRSQGVMFTLGSDPRYAWYVDGLNPAEELRNMGAVRDVALASYGPGMLKKGEPYGAMRDLRLWMIYLHEQYAIEYGLRYIGGQFQNIVVKGKETGLPPTEFIPAEEQREILGLLLDVLEPGHLAMPESLLAQLAPSPGENNEDMSDDAVFDQLRAARILAAQVLEPLFDGDRASRMIALAVRQPDTLTFPEMVDAVLANSWKVNPSGSAQDRALLRVVQNVAMLSMMKLGADEDTAADARYYVLDQLGRLAEDLNSRTSSDPLTSAFYRESARQIERYLEDPEAPERIMPVWGKEPRSRFPAPPGPPL
ncbi:hypothetical protein FHS61_002557 [Altererythrobacter atlanticus]|nr:zinc-dependent metalloprotease [Croceibacterium atlanticum]MBB5733522.1 hypothetical protein [Croceibacterium atlanticum]